MDNINSSMGPRQGPRCSDDLVSEDQIEHLTLEIKSFLEDSRLDHYLAGRLAHYSRSYVQKLIRRGMVKVNGEVRKPKFQLHRGDIIELDLPVIIRPGQFAEDIPLDIVYQDDDFVALNKPAGMVTHPAKGHTRGTLVNALLHHCEWRPEDPNDVRPGVVHRLDKNTTGIMLFAKHELSQSRIQQQFERREVQKTYVAIVHGDPQFDEDIISQPLAQHRVVRQKRTVDRVEGKEAVTLYRVQERFGDYALVQAEPKTGRTHQIRVHLSHIRHPIVCDTTYGALHPMLYRSQLLGQEPAPDEQPLVERTALHALSIELNHPSTGKRMTFEAPLPPDMQALLDALRQRGPRESEK